MRSVQCPPSSSVIHSLPSSVPAQSSPAFTGDPISLAIAGPDGRPIANLTAPGVPGFSRVVWDLKPGKDVLNDYGGEGQKFVRPGEYEVTLTFGKTTQKEKVKVDIAKGLETR